MHNSWIHRVAQIFLQYRRHISPRKLPFHPGSSPARLDREFTLTQEGGCVWISNNHAQLYTSVGYSHAGLVSKLVRQIAKAWKAESGYR
jgi:hypothetical protein